MSTYHNHRFLNEGEDYRVARDALLAAEIELRAKAEEVAALRRIRFQGQDSLLLELNRMSAPAVTATSLCLV